MKVYEAVAARIQELCEKRKMTVNGQKHYLWSK